MGIYELGFFLGINVLRQLLPLRRQPLALDLSRILFQCHLFDQILRQPLEHMLFGKLRLKPKRNENFLVWSSFYFVCWLIRYLLQPIVLYSHWILFNTVNQKCPLLLTYFVSTSRYIEKNAKRRPLRVEMDRIVLQRLIRWPGFYSLRLLGFSIWCIGIAIFKLKNHLIGAIIG